MGGEEGWWCGWGEGGEGAVVWAGRRGGKGGQWCRWGGAVCGRGGGAVVWAGRGRGGAVVWAGGGGAVDSVHREPPTSQSP